MKALLTKRSGRRRSCWSLRRSEDLEDLCEMDWSEVSQHRIMISETSDGSAAKQQQLGYCLQVELGPAPRNLPQLTLRRGQCAAKTHSGTKSDVRACGTFEGKRTGDRGPIRILHSGRL